MPAALPPNIGATTNSTPPAPLAAAVARVPPGAWAVGVSGGADSVALLLLLLSRAELKLHVVHLDHQARGPASAADASFVADVAQTRRLDCTIETLAGVEASSEHLNPNRSARFREARLALFRRVVAERSLQGVVLAHHADDQAETILQRLLRGSSWMGLTGMSITANVNGLSVWRPLLGIRGAVLRQYLQDLGQQWREDASNQSPAYLRNRLRVFLRQRPGVTDCLLDLGHRAAALRAVVRAAAPELPDVISVSQLGVMPSLLARQSLGRWLVSQGCPVEDVGPQAIDRLLEMASDAASGPRCHFPGGVLVCRRGGKISGVVRRKTDKGS